NQGGLTLSGGTLDLGGTFTVDSLGDFRNGGGTVNLTGTLNNQGRILVFDAAHPAWQLAGGTIDGGTVLLNDGTRLATAMNTSCRLNGVAVDGYVDASTGSLAITNGLTVNGILAVGGTGNSFGRVTFNGTQSLVGAATVLLGDSSLNFVGASSGVVT